MRRMPSSHLPIPAHTRHAHLQLLDGIAGIALGVVSNPLRANRQGGNGWHVAERAKARGGSGTSHVASGCCAAIALHMHKPMPGSAVRGAAAATHHNEVQLNDLRGMAGQGGSEGPTSVFASEDSPNMQALGACPAGGEADTTCCSPRSP